MSLRERWHQWRTRNRQAEDGEQDTVLREFVYLDEVSVYSLMASRRGPVVAELTESQSSSLLAEMGSSIDASAAVLKAGMTSRVESTQTGGSQVVRKSIIQSTFKDLLDLEQERLRLRMREDEPEDGQAADLAALDRLLRDARDAGWAVEAEELRRGQLLELEVELEAEPIYKLNTTMSSLLQMFTENPSLVPAADQAGLGEGMTVVQVLESLLGGLIPLRGRAIDYHHITLGDRQWIVHRRLVSPEVRGMASVRPLYVVAVTEEQLFWRNIRRVLFSRATYTVLCRLARDGAHDAWTPVKLVDVLRDVLPHVAAQIDDMQKGLFTQLGEPGAQSMQREVDQLSAALCEFGQRLAVHYGKVVDISELAPVASAAVAELPDDAMGTVEGIRAASGRVIEHVQRRHGIPDEPRVAAQLRYESMTAARLLPGDASDALPQPTVGVAQPNDQRYLDAEVVAIYW